MHTKWNHKFVLLIVITILSAAVFFAGQFGQARIKAKAGPNDDAPLVVLYDQNNNPAGSSTGSQNFEASSDPFDDFLGDDFVVPALQTWNVNQVNATGVYFNGTGPAASFNVFFYPDVATFPGPTATCTYNAAAFTNVSGSFSITLPANCVLASGTYWVVVQANMDFVPGGQWGWTDRTVTSNSGAVWRNPGGGFMNAPCTANWGRRAGAAPAGL